jgi:hypothetical protein
MAGLAPSRGPVTCKGTGFAQARAAELPEEWVDAVRKARVPDEFAHLDAELK